PQVVGQFTLTVDTLEDGLLALRELPEMTNPILDLADDLLVEATGPLLAVAGVERDRIALVEQLDHVFHLDLADLHILCNTRTVESHFVHGCVNPGPGRKPGAAVRASGFP